MKKHLAIFLSLLIIVSAAAQDVNYARNILNELTSDKYHGRGYVKNGDAKAAKFIEKQFKTHGLNNFNESYFQKYSFPINTFPKTVTVSIDNQELVPGEDYVISLSSPSVDTEYEIHNLSQLGSNQDSLVMAMHDIGGHGMYFIKEKNTRNSYGKTITGVEAVAILTEKNPYWHVSNGSKVENTMWLKIKSNKVSDTAKKIKVKVKNRFIEDHQTQNVVAYVEGSKYPNKYFVFTAHYDHLGMMGNKTYYPGANDNASGTSMVLDLARHFSLPENKPEYSIVFILFSGEEAGLYGSKYFANNPLFPLKDIKLLVNLDMVGSGSDGITVVNATLYDELFNKMKTINNPDNYRGQFLKEIKSRGESCNSDHCPFYQKGVKSIFIYTRGKELTEYHTVYDTSDNFPFTAYDGLFGLLTGLVQD